MCIFAFCLGFWIHKIGYFLFIYLFSLVGHIIASVNNVVVTVLYLLGLDTDEL